VSCPTSKPTCRHDGYVVAGRWPQPGKGYVGSLGAPEQSPSQRDILTVENQGQTKETSPQLTIHEIHVGYIARDRGRVLGAGRGWGGHGIGLGGGRLEVRVLPVSRSRNWVVEKKASSSPMLKFSSPVESWELMTLRSRKYWDTLGGPAAVVGRH